MKHRTAFICVALAFVIAVALGLPALAQEAAEPAPMPWDDVVIPIGGVALLWGGVVAAIIQLLKHVQWDGRPILANSTHIWGANLLLGGVGMFIAALQSGSTALAALLYAGEAVLSAVGTFEFAKKAGQSFLAKPSDKPPNENAPTTTE